MPEEIVIRTGELAVSHNDTVIKTGSIGSCVVIALYDEEKRVGGMAHAMLPECKNAEDYKCDDRNMARYVDQAVNNLIYQLEKVGGKKENFVAKIVGGASMFKHLATEAHGIGKRNVDVARDSLEKNGIRIKSADTGGSSGKVAEFNLANGVLEIFTRL